MGRKKRTDKQFKRDLLIGLGVICLMVIGVLSYSAVQAEVHLSEAYIEQSTTRAADAYQALASKMESSLRVVRDYAGNGLLRWEDVAGMQQVLAPLLSQNELLNGISVVNSDGYSVYLSLEEGRVRTSQNGPTKKGRERVLQFWQDGALVETRAAEASEYDARTRAWYGPALATDEVSWTLPYPFYGETRVGVTASMATPEDVKGVRRVVAFDILQDDLYAQIQAMAPSENSQVFVLVQEEARLYHKAEHGAAARFVEISEIEDPLLRSAYGAWSGRSGRESRIRTIHSEGQVWWCGFKPLDTRKHEVWVGVLVPAQDISTGVKLRRWRLVLIAVLLLMGSVGPLLWLARRYWKPSQGVRFEREDPEGSIRRLIELGEGTTIEFKSTMRMNLHSKKPGKEIEMAWLKGVAAFLNTDGGTLLMGVTDEGEITGLERDVFENEDKCQLHFKNLIAAHLGAEYSTYIEFQIVHVEGKQVGVVQCERAAEPVYLKHPKGEDFFIRNGPSSDALPVSKVMEYVRGR